MQEVRSVVDINNRGLNYGDAVFETIKISAGKIYFWEQHYFRLMSSMRILRMEIPNNFTMEFLEEEMLKQIENIASQSNAYRVKILVWRRTGGKYTPTTRDVDYVITAEALEVPFYVMHDQPYEVELFKDHFVLADMLSNLKTNNRLVNVLAGIYASENSYDNCLLLNEKKQVIEALNGNIFLVKGNTIKTPPISDGCINGILRKEILNMLQSMPEFKVEEISISPFELQKADEMFITNVISGIIPITRYRKKEYAKNMAQNLLAKLNMKARLS